VTNAPARRAARPQPPASGRLASMFFVLGCLTVLGVTFALGVAAGRRWPDGLPGLRGVRTVATAAPAPTSSERDKRAEGRKSATDPPVLTFYRELTAPLTPAPPVARAVAKPEVKTARPAAPPKPVIAEAAATAEPMPREKASAEPRFTVQVGAFKTRSQAEAVRARLAEMGQDVYLSETEAGGVTQYRVRVGTFTTREEARQAALRLASERQVATYVTTR